jgi:DNA invertase Pin-like site-specific DNA recombinase
MLIGYARVSTAEQNLDLQRDALQRAGCDRIFTDQASGARGDRRGLADALSHARKGDTLVVWKLDRLGRTVRQLVEFAEDLRAAGIGFKSLTDSIDTTTPAGRFFFHMMAALAEMERGLLQERTRAGLVAAKARGRNGGRRPKLTPTQIEMAERLLRDPSSTVVAVAATFGVGRATLYRALNERQSGREAPASTPHQSRSRAEETAPPRNRRMAKQGAGRP